MTNERLTIEEAGSPEDVKNKGWHNLYHCLQIYSVPAGMRTPGTIYFGPTVHPDKETAERYARWWLSQATLDGTPASDCAEWLGAFEVSA
jgi:hypothetical protein